jgi:histone acetyltransferase (RNA polymerase elongator complex component)
MLERKHFTIPLFFPQLACPFQCVFCNQEKITSRGHIPDEREVKETIENHLATFPEGDKYLEVGFFGGTFTGMPLQEQEKVLKITLPYREKGIIKGIRLSTRPDYISVEALNLLKKYGVTTIELGAQSMDDEVLTCSARGHTAEDTEVASRMILDHGFRLGLQMMIGLPGDKKDKDIYTARRIIELGALETRIYPTLIVKGTKLEEWYEKGEYQPLTLEEAVNRLKEILPLFEEAGVEVTRVGLLSSRGFLKEDFLAGPYHPSIRELAMTEVWWDRLKDLADLPKGYFLMIIVNPSQYNVAIGYHGKNRKKLMKTFSTVVFATDESLKENQYYADHR